MSRKKWQVKKYDKEKVSVIAEKLNLNPYAVLIASTRGINTVEEAEEFFGLSNSAFADPMDFPDMYKAVKRIHEALENFERIAIYGDYDCDGVTATSLLYSYLEMQGADVVYCAPDRKTDGYGLNFSAVDNMCKMGAKLIVTVDNGISAVEEAKYIKELEMELIVTDHHLPSDVLPEAVAVVDPHRNDCILEFKDYAGVGVAYKLICALEGGENEVTDSFLDLTSLGTIADVMPIINENRVIVRRGVALINETDRAGIQALEQVAGIEDKEITSVNVAFGLVPRINAAGRMGSAMRAIRMLLSDDYDEAVEIAEEINNDNVLRQQTEQEILSQALEQINNNEKWLYDRVLVVDGKDWHEGVIGIVASRLVDKFGKPAIVITKGDDTAKGSGRSIEGFNLYEALSSCSSVLNNFGGHTLAAGLGIDNDKIENFREAINSYASSIDMPVREQNIDFKINPSYVNTEMIDVIASLEPFGTGNSQPVFGLFNMTITEIQPIGNGKHLRLSLKRDGTVLSAVMFKMTQLDFPFIVGDNVDIAATFDKNEYLGQIRLSIFVKDIRPHNTNEDALFSSMREFSDLMSGRGKINPADVLPEREEVAQVYKFIRSHGAWHYDIEMLCLRMGWQSGKYAKAAVAVKALTQLGTIIRDDEGNLTLPDENAKVNLDDAPVLIRIKNLK